MEFARLIGYFGTLPYMSVKGSSVRNTRWTSTFSGGLQSNFKMMTGNMCSSLSRVFLFAWTHVIFGAGFGIIVSCILGVPVIFWGSQCRFGAHAQDTCCFQLRCFQFIVSLFNFCAVPILSISMGFFWTRIIKLFSQPFRTVTFFRKVAEKWHVQWRTNRVANPADHSASGNSAC